MLRYASSLVTRLYSVEISGWDGKEDFFVEKCELEWNEETGKGVALKRALNDRAILLVRLLQTGDSDRSQPVVYQAEVIGKTKSGLCQFRLNVVAPRLREEESSALLPKPIQRPADRRRKGEGTVEFRTETTP
jgi:hypothetical protein